MDRRPTTYSLSAEVPAQGLRPGGHRPLPEKPDREHRQEGGNATARPGGDAGPCACLPGDTTLQVCGLGGPHPQGEDRLRTLPGLPRAASHVPKGPPVVPWEVLPIGGLGDRGCD